jgi:hypothetical protein
MTILNNKVKKDYVPKLTVNNNQSVSYALNLTTASNGVGVKAARANTFLKQ